MSKPTIVSIGNFDGVHLGHRRIIARAQELAAARDAEVAVLTFDPHPATVLRPHAAPPRLMTCDEKVAALRDAGVGQVDVMAPTPELLALSPKEFVHKLTTEHNAVGVVEGPDFRFGADRGGDVALLRDYGESHGFETVVIEPLQVALSDQLLATASSSLVRWLIGRGRVVDAAICLGRPYEMTATVVEGEQRGRTINVPTANLDLDSIADKLVPCDGVYAGKVLIQPTPDSGPRTPDSAIPAAISVGVKPTFGEKQLTVEAHLLDFDDDLYDRTVTVRFERWVRDQQAFPRFEDLRAQIDRDIRATRKWFEMAG